MKKINLKYHIASQDSNTSFETTGEYNNDRIKFVDPEGNRNYIIFKKNEIEYYKKGSMDMKFSFTLNVSTKGLYSVSGYQLEFTIKTKYLQHTDTSLYIEYDLYQDNDLVNTTKLNIEFTSLKED